MRKVKSLDWFSSKKDQPAGQSELQALLDLLPYAALAVDITHDTIQHANQKAVELTGLTHHELRARQLSQLLPAGTLTELLQSPSSLYPVPLTRHLGTVIEVYLELHAIGTPSSLQILKIEPVQERDRLERQQRQQERYSARMAGFLAALQETDPARALERVCEASLVLLEADTIGLYQATGDHPGAARLVALGQHTDLLPPEVTALDLALLKEPLAWNTRRVHRPEIHRSLRTAGFRGLLTAPLGSRQAMTGALIAFKKDEFPPDSASLLYESAQISEIISNQQARLTNLQPSMQEAQAIRNLQNAIWDQVSDSLVQLDDQLMVRNVNRAALTSLGYSHQEACGLRAEDLFICDALIEPALNQLRQGHTAPISMPTRLFRRGGGSFQTTLRFLPLSPPGNAAYVLVIFQDQSEHEQVRLRNEQLEQRALLGEVTASFAHEVRNPINNISTGLQVLEMALSPDDPNQLNIQRLQQDCNRLNELIKNGLAFIKPMEYTLERIDMNVLLRGLLDRWQHRLSRDKIQLVFQPEPTPPLIEGDPRAVEQIFNNLFINAVQAMQAQPAGESASVLGVRVRRLGQLSGMDQIEVAVSDTGVGISEQTRDHIFEPFFTTKSTGTGLGLAILKRIITAHKGSVQVTSFPGATVFTVRFPAV